MSTNNNLDLAALRALHAAATPGKWDRHPSPKKWVLLPIPEDADPNNDANPEFCIAAHNDIPALLEQLYRTEVERDHWRQLLVSLDMESLCDAHLGMGVEEYLQKWLADRDASMKALGAAEALERMAKEECSTVFPGDLPHVTKNDLLEEAARLRREAGDDER